MEDVLLEGTIVKHTCKLVAFQRICCFEFKLGGWVMRSGKPVRTKISALSSFPLRPWNVTTTIQPCTNTIYIKQLNQKYVIFRMITSIQSFDGALTLTDAVGVSLRKPLWSGKRRPWNQLIISGQFLFIMRELKEEDALDVRSQVQMELDLASGWGQKRGERSPAQLPVVTVFLNELIKWGMQNAASAQNK